MAKRENVSSIVLDPELKKRLAAFAAKQTTSTSAVVRQAVIAFLEAHNGNHQDANKQLVA